MSQLTGAFQRGLGFVDFTLLVIGAVIGADIYIVAGLAAAYLGPAQLVAWVAAGVLAGVIALAFIQCALICPEVGGSYAYTRQAFGPLAGFLAGWALYAGEWIALPVFPLTFVRYLGYFFPNLPLVATVLIKAGLIALVTWVNLAGVRSGGRVNDVLTTVKLLPLLVLVGAGLLFAGTRASAVTAHLQPFAPLGWRGFGSASVLIFWAYAGFELAVMPAGEVVEPRRTLPLGLTAGVAVSILFYLFTSFAVVVALPWRDAASSARPLTDALGAILSGLGMPAIWGRLLMSTGALISVVGVYEVFSLALARLSYALAADGLFPAPFARLHPRFGTPVAGLAFQAASALAISLFFDVRGLITIAVFFLGICYLATALAALRLSGQNPQQRLRLPGLRVVLGLAAAGGVYLSVQAPLTLLLLGVAVMAVGLVAYLLRRETWALAPSLRADEAAAGLMLWHWAHHGEAWLLHFVRRTSPERSSGQ